MTEYMLAFIVFLLGFASGFAIAMEMLKKIGFDVAYEILDEHAPSWRNK